MVVAPLADGTFAGAPPRASRDSRPGQESRGGQSRPALGRSFFWPAGSPFHTDPQLVPWEDVRIFMPHRAHTQTHTRAHARRYVPREYPMGGRGYVRLQGCLLSTPARGIVVPARAAARNLSRSTSSVAAPTRRQAATHRTDYCLSGPIHLTRCRQAAVWCYYATTSDSLLREPPRGGRSSVQRSHTSCQKSQSARPPDDPSRPRAVWSMNGVAPERA